VPENGSYLVGAPEASWLKPLTYGVPGSSGEVQVLVDFPAQLALTLQKRTEPLRCAFLSPIDYARHGGDYLIVPGASVASSGPSNTIKLFINPSVKNIDRMAVDIRVTSEIILAKILLAEKFPNLSSDTRKLEFLPMLANRDEMLRKADAALVVNFHPEPQKADDPFSLDLVDEWSDLTGLPYVHGLWVGHDEPEAEQVAQMLLRSKELGVSHLEQIAQKLSRDRHVVLSECRKYFGAFRYQLGEEEQESLSEFIRFAYYHGVLPDVPDLNFYEITPTPPATVQ
jgi:chorismate dehydratase